MKVTHLHQAEAARAHPARSAKSRRIAGCLTNRDMDALLAVMANPPEPNAAMRRAIVTFRDEGGEVPCSIRRSINS